jgi:flagellin-like hook-associated protein FlgL
MATNNVALTASMRSNLLSLKNTQRLFDKTQDRLSTGYKVNSAMDNPSSYFTAQALNSRAGDLSTLLDSIGQAVSTLETADAGITTLQKYVDQAKSIANSARDTANVASSVKSDGVTFNSATAKTDLLSDLMPNISDGDKFTIRLGDATKMEASANVALDHTLEQIGLADGAEFEMIVGDKTYKFDIGAEAAEPSVGPDGVTSQTFTSDMTLEDFMSDVVYTVGRKVLNAEVKDGKLSFNTMDNSALVVRSTAEFDDTDFNTVFGFDAGHTVTYTDDMTVEKFRQAINNLDGITADFDNNGKMVISGEQGDDMVIADFGTGTVAKSLLGKSIVDVTNGSNERAKYAQQYDDVLTQIDQLVQDTSYKGINLLKGDDLTVVFNESRTSTLELKGVTLDAQGLGFTRTENEWMTNEVIDKSLNQITKATSMLRAQASEFGQNLSTVQIRSDFTENMINNLTVGADKLTLADMNEEAANMLALQTRQQLGTNSLSLASQAAQSVLSLF